MKEIKEGLTMIGLVFVLFSLLVAVEWVRHRTANFEMLGKWMFFAVWGLIGLGVASWAVSAIYWGAITTVASVFGLRW